MTPRRVLVIDDEPDMRSMLESYLAFESIDVVSVASGLAGLRELESSAFDVVLLDVHMPGMTGPETLAILRQRWASQPVVVMTSAIRASDARHEWERLANGLIVKPFNLDDLMNVLGQAMDPGRNSQAGTATP